MFLPFSLVYPISVLTIVTGLLFSSKSPQVVAHRGASGWAPETTPASYRLALEMKADYLELDVQMTKDGEIVAIHDALVDRTTNGKGAIGEITLAQLKELDAGSWFNRTYPEKASREFAGQRVPTLQEVIDLAKNSGAGLYIETKNPELYPPNFEAMLLDIVRRNGFEKRVMVQSFNGRSVQKVKELDAGIPTALLIEISKGDPVDDTLAAGANELAIEYKQLTPEILSKAQKRGLTVAVWTVDEEEDLRRMIHLGVQRIITNYPDRLNRLLGR